MEIDALCQVLQSMQIHKLIALVKLIHTPVCSRYNIQEETKDHILSCRDPDAVLQRLTRVQKWRLQFQATGTGLEIIKRLEYYQTNMMNLPQQTVSPTPTELAKVTQHQNIIGWRQLMCGFISTLWKDTQDKCTVQQKTCGNWRWTIVKLTLELHREVSDDKNKKEYEFLHEKGSQAIPKPARS
jgi:hypothetical protein